MMTRRFIKLSAILMFLSLGVGFSLEITKTTSAPSRTIAIFDYDDRLDEPETVAKYIESRLNEEVAGFSIHQFSGKGDNEVSYDILREIDTKGYDLLITITSDALLMVKHLVKRTPVVFTNVNNPIFLGIEDLSSPGNNITGASYYVPVDRQIDLFLRIDPSIKSFGVVFDLGNKSHRIELRETGVALRNRNLGFQYELVDSSDELAGAVELLIERGVQAVIISSSNTIYDYTSEIRTVTDSAGIPLFSYNRKSVKDGAIASLSSDYYEMVDELVVPMVRQILVKGRNPGTIPVGFMKENILSINASAASYLGIEISEELKLRAQHLY